MNTLMVSEAQRMRESSKPKSSDLTILFAFAIPILFVGASLLY